MRSDTTTAQEFLLRQADTSDIRRLFEWRNDPWIVSMSTTRREVTWEEHQAWFNSVLDRSKHLLFIIHADDATPVGSVRLDRVGSEAVVSVYLLKPFTGVGLGPRAIEEGCRNAFEDWPELTRVIAYIRTDNQRSKKAFTRVLFQPCLDAIECPDGHVALVRRRDGL
jgi:UDP-2,4-diacetamido-2,4,6-trideoxy-beta-L-altropyranose hydrolase